MPSVTLQKQVSESPPSLIKNDMFLLYVTVQILAVELLQY